MKTVLVMRIKWYRKAEFIRIALQKALQFCTRRPAELLFIGTYSTMFSRRQSSTEAITRSMLGMLLWKRHLPEILPSWWAPNIRTSSPAWRRSWWCCVCEPGIPSQLYVGAQPLSGWLRRLSSGCLQWQVAGWDSDDGEVCQEDREGGYYTQSSLREFF